MIEHDHMSRDMDLFQLVVGDCVSILSILSGQGWHRRANAQKRYKSPPNGQPIN